MVQRYYAKQELSAILPYLTNLTLQCVRWKQIYFRKLESFYEFTKLSVLKNSKSKTDLENNIGKLKFWSIIQILNNQILGLRTSQVLKVQDVLCYSKHKENRKICLYYIFWDLVKNFLYFKYQSRTHRNEMCKTVKR